VPPSAFLVVVASLLCAATALAAERELEDAPAPSSAEEIRTPIERVFPIVFDKPPLFPLFRDRIQSLPSFFSDMRLEARFRTYYLRSDRTIGILSEAWAIGGSVYYRSGWLADTFAAELEGFTSQPIIAQADRGATGLLTLDQQGYGALGIANGTLRYKGVYLTGYRQYLDLPYVNRHDSRMTPNTFESITLQKPEGRIRFSTGYTWKIKRRTSENFVSMSEAVGLGGDRGVVHGGVVWDPHDAVQLGVVVGAMPEVFTGIYTETALVGRFWRSFETRIDGQFTYQDSATDDARTGEIVDAWNLGLRGSTSWRGLVLRIGLSVTGDDGTVINPFGSSPSYVSLMQRGFNRGGEKALLASLSYDFRGLRFDELSLIVNVVAGFDGREGDAVGDSQEVDVTLDYRVKKGLFESFWLRVRASWLGDDLRTRDGTDVRVILRYDFPVI
jgi:hypothetical protein